MEAFPVVRGASVLRYHELMGGGPTCVYLHGLGLDSTSLLGLASHPLLRGMRSLVVDFLGFGRSDKPDDFGYTIEEHADAVIGLLVKLDVSGSALVGHSMGGSVAIMFASRRPDLVSRLVVAEANLDPGMGPVSAGILAQTEDAYVARAGATELASPVAMCRSARSLTRERRPSFHDLLLEIEASRTFLVGSRTLEMDEKPVSGECGGR